MDPWTTGPEHRIANRIRVWWLHRAATRVSQMSEQIYEKGEEVHGRIPFRARSQLKTAEALCRWRAIGHLTSDISLISVPAALSSKTAEALCRCRASVISLLGLSHVTDDRERETV